MDTSSAVVGRPGRGMARGIGRGVCGVVVAAVALLGLPASRPAHPSHSIIDLSAAHDIDDNTLVSLADEPAASRVPG
jgi:hypothetical protein